MDPETTVVLVQEKDVSIGSCRFSTLFENFSEVLYNPPNSLFNDLAIPLYSEEKYRFVSLSKILVKMGAIPKGRRSQFSSSLKSWGEVLIGCHLGAVCRG